MIKQDMCPTATPGPNGWGSRNHNHTLVLMAVIALGILLCCRLAMPFLSVLAWALALAVVFAPFHRWLESKLRRRNLAATVSVLIVLLIIVVPASVVGQRLVLEAAKGAQLVTAKLESGDWRRAIEAHPRIAFLAAKIEREVDLAGTVQALAGWLTNIATSIVQGSVVQMFGFLLTFYLLFFFLRDRSSALQALRHLSPLSDMEMDRVLLRVRDTIGATLYGTLAVAAVQGVLGGLMFWWLGLPAPLLWGAVMAVLGLVPVVGGFIIWVPVALILALDGSWGKALLLTVWGMLVVSGTNNVLYPILVGNRLRLHTVPVFISVVGGLILFGPAGFILGPMVFTITAVLLEIWHGRSAVEMAATGANRAEAKEEVSAG